MADGCWFLAKYLTVILYPDPIVKRSNFRKLLDTIRWPFSSGGGARISAQPCRWSWCCFLPRSIPKHPRVHTRSSHCPANANLSSAPRTGTSPLLSVMVIENQNSARSMLPSSTPLVDGRPAGRSSTGSVDEAPWLFRLLRFVLVQRGGSLHSLLQKPRIPLIGCLVSHRAHGWLTKRRGMR